MSMKPLISFYCGGIRPQNWKRLYDSIGPSVGKHSFELVICGPTKGIPDELEPFRNIKFIRDFGSSCRAAQLAAYFSEGRLLTLTADDGWYMPGAMERAIDHYLSKEHHKFVLGLKYGEHGDIFADGHWQYRAHPPLVMEGIPQEAPVILNSIMSTDYYKEMGGYEAEHYGHTNWSGHSFYLRLRNDGAQIELFPEGVLMCEWEEGCTGTHEPIHKTDCPSEPTSNYGYFKSVWEKPNGLARTNFESWRQAESVWSMRFK